MEIDWERREMEEQADRDADERVALTERVDHLLGMLLEPGFDNDGGPRSLSEGLDLAIESMQARIDNHDAIVKEQGRLLEDLAEAAIELYQWVWYGEVKSRDIRQLADAIEAAGFDPDRLEHEEVD